MTSWVLELCAWTEVGIRENSPYVGILTCRKSCDWIIWRLLRVDFSSRWLPNPGYVAGSCSQLCALLREIALAAVRRSMTMP